MTAHLEDEALEGLARGELSEGEQAPLSAHLKECDACQKQLAWVRAEQELFARRARVPASPDLFAGIEKRLPPAPRVELAPPQKRSRFASQRLQWIGVAATAAAMLAMLSLGGAVPLHLSSRTMSLFEHKQKIEAAPAVLTTTVDVKGATALRISTGSAEVDIVAGALDKVRMQVTDSEVHGIELGSAAPGELVAMFDKREGLESGQVHLEVPVGTRLEVLTASGSVRILGVGGEVRVRTASGDLRIREATKLELDTASGDLLLEDIKGPTQIRTASGDVRFVSDSVPIGAIDFNSASGELDLNGVCAAGCKVIANTASGDVALRARAGSAYTVRFRSMSGDIENEDGEKKPEAEEQDEAPHGTEKNLRVGNGAGSIFINSQSGDLRVEKP